MYCSTPLSGLDPPQVHHRNVPLKFVGLMLCAAGLFIRLAFTCLLLTLEATAAVGEPEAMSVAIQSLLRSPWSVTDLNSVYLFGLGTLWALGAFWKGYTFDDPFPSYGAVSRRIHESA